MQKEKIKTYHGTKSRATEILEKVYTKELLKDSGSEKSNR